MKDTDIHVGLPEKELRNFFSQSIQTYTSVDTKAEKNYKWNDEDPYLNTIENLKIDLIDLDKSIKKFENLRSVHKLMKAQGWKEHDCSDYVTRSDTGKSWLNFIGTEEEFQIFIKVNFDI